MAGTKQPGIGCGGNRQIFDINKRWNPGKIVLDKREDCRLWGRLFAKFASARFALASATERLFERSRHCKIILI